MDIYHRFSQCSSTNAPSGITFPPDMKAFIYTSTTGNTLINLITYGVTGGTQNMPISLGSGTFIFPIKLWGFTGPSNPYISYLVAF